MSPLVNLQLSDGRVVRGLVDGLVEKPGAQGRLRLAIANAELGLPTGLPEPIAGHVTVRGPTSECSHWVLDLRGAEVIRVD